MEDKALISAAVMGELPARGVDVHRLMNDFFTGLTKETLRAYRCDLQDFRACVGVATVEEAARVLLSHGSGEANARVIEYKAHLVGRGLSAATINRRLAALRSLVKLARTVGMVPWKLEIRGLKTETYRDTRGPGRDGLVLMLKALSSRNDAKATRDYAILRLLYDLALRRGEVARLDVEDVDLDTGELSILGKARTQRETRSLPDPTKTAVEKWLKVRGEESGPLFRNFDRAGKGSRLTDNAIYKIVRALGNSVGVKVRPHGLRHTAITEALDLMGGDFRAVQRYSRHRDPRVLNLYDDNRIDLAGEVARRVASSCQA